jgi:hypothetical protein
MGKYSTSVSGYDANTAIGRFYHRDAENEVGFEMRMTMTEYHALGKFLETTHKTAFEQGRQEVSNAVRSALPTTADEPK